MSSPKSRPFSSPLDKAKGYEVVWQQVSAVFDTARGMSDVCFVYVIGEQDDGPVKIGVAKDPIARLRAMQTGNPRRLRVEHILIGDMPIEKLLHELWEPFAITSLAKRGKVGAAPGTEWFRSEVRTTLFPILATAAEQQAIFIGQTSNDIHAEDLEKIVRLAHQQHDFVAIGRDEVRLLAPAAGYAVARPSRI